MLVLDDIVKLYDEPLNGKTIGAIIDPGQVKALERLGIDSDDLYFNSGVMVIDIDQWNKKKLQKKLSITSVKMAIESSITTKML